jgi:polysaccharide biosynthesis protein PslH
MRILQVCYKLPFPQRDGGSYSLHSAARAILQDPSNELVVLAMQLKKNGESHWNVPVEFKKKTFFESIEVDNRVNFLEVFKNLFSGVSYFSSRFRSEEFALKLIEVLRQNEFEIVQIEHVYLCQYVPLIRQVYKGKIVLRTQNVETSLWLSNSKQLPWFKILSRFYLRLQIERLRKEEKEALFSVDGILCLTQVDFHAIRCLGIGTKMSVIALSANSQVEKPDVSNPTFYHLGSMDWLPNLIGLNWFFDKVLPLVEQCCVHFELHCGGKDIAKSLAMKKRRSVIFHEHVHDSIDFQLHKGVLVVPLRSGSGIRVKIIEAMALGKAIISTSIGAQGIPYIHGVNILIADSPEDFAFAIFQCHTSAELRQSLGYHAHQTYLEYYDIQVIASQTSEFYHEVIND